MQEYENDSFIKYDPYPKGLLTYTIKEQILDERGC
jgi:hypothetical protein